MCRTTQWRLIQTESKRRPVPGEFFRFLSPVGNGKGPGRLASPNPVHLIGMKGEPVSQPVIEIAHLTRAEQMIVSRLAFQAPAAGVPVRARIGKVKCVNQRCIGVGAEQQRPLLLRQPGATACRGLAIPQFVPGGA
jgi:hypothetical protein